jgi:hypothetical protein
MIKVKQIRGRQKERDTFALIVGGSGWWQSESEGMYEEIYERHRTCLRGAILSGIRKFMIDAIMVECI